MRAHIAARAIFCLGLLGVGAFAHADSAAAGRVVKVVGDVMRIDPQNGQKFLAVGDTFSVGDVLQTGPDARIKVVMSEGGNEVVLGRATRLLIERSGSLARNSETGTTLSLREGQVRSVVKKKYSGSGNDVFEVRTPNAVAGVRGTTFLVSFDQKKFRSLLATEEGAVVWSSQGKQLLVAKGKFSTVSGKDISMPTAIESSPSVSSEVKEVRSEAATDNGDSTSTSSGATSVASDPVAKSSTTTFDASGNEVVVETVEAPQNTTRAPASVAEAAPASSASTAVAAGPSGMPKASMGGVERKMALAKVPETASSPAAGSGPVASGAADILKDQRGLQDQTTFVKKNSDKLNPAVVSAPVK